MKHHTLGEMNPSEPHFNAVPRTPVERAVDAARVPVTPPRETLHEETLRWLGAMQAVAPHTHEGFGAQLERIAYAAQCVRDVAALREQVEALEDVARKAGDVANERFRDLAALRAENARLASAAAIVEAMEYLWLPHAHLNVCNLHIDPKDIEDV